MRILLLSSAFNGLTQRAWIELRRAGHDVTVELAVSQAATAASLDMAFFLQGGPMTASGPRMRTVMKAGLDPRLSRW